jgi:hypothetical protein
MDGESPRPRGGPTDPDRGRNREVIPVGRPRTETRAPAPRRRGAVAAAGDAGTMLIAVAVIIGVAGWLAGGMLGAPIAGAMAGGFVGVIAAFTLVYLRFRDL